MEKKKKKKLLIILGSVLGAIVVFFIILMLSIGAIVKVAVGSVLPDITGTPCSMGMCTFNPLLGKVTIRNFVIGNPEGYAHPNAFKLGTMVVDVGMNSLFSDKIVIEKIIIEGMEADFETKLTETNLSTIKSNIDNYGKNNKTQAEKKDKEESPATGEAENSKPEEKAGKGKKLQIDLFRFVDNKITIGAAGETVSVPMADIVIKDIGTDNPEGATVGEVSQKVFFALYKSIEKAAREQSVKTTGKTIKDASDKFVKGVKGLFGEEKKK